jgi:hypothetical protein
MPKRKSLADLETRLPEAIAPEKPPLKGDRIHISIHMPRTTWQRVKMLAIHKGVRANNLWLTAMDEYLKREGLPGVKS